MAESELLKKLKEEGIGIKGVFRILEEEKAEIQITQLVNYNNNMWKNNICFYCYHVGLEYQKLKDLTC